MKKIFFKNISRIFGYQLNKFQKAAFTSLSFLAITNVAYQYTQKIQLESDSNKIGYFEIQADKDLQEGQMKEIQVGTNKDDKVLLVKYQDKYYCVQNSCPHFGFSLAKGLLVQDKVMCPLHNAGFSILDGVAEQGPVLDGLQIYEVIDQGDQLLLKVPMNAFQKQNAFKFDKSALENDNRKFVIIGGGPAGLSAAETLRQAGFQGKITIVSDENFNPYDRTLLTKAFGDPSSKFSLRSDENLNDYGIEIIKGKKCIDIDSKNQFVSIQDGQTLYYDKLLIATGSKAFIPPIKGMENQNVFQLRNKEDLQKISNNIQELQKKKDFLRIVVIGGSFIGMEVSSTLKKELKEKAEIEVLMNTQYPFQQVFGQDIGNYLKSVHEKNGVKIIGSQNIKSIEHIKDKLVLHTDDLDYQADLIIVGTGANPNTSFIKDIQLDKDGSILTNPFLQTSQQNVYAAGDIAKFPNLYIGENQRIEHYNVALGQGRNAALNMLEKNIPFTEVPYFFTRFFDKTYHLIGSSQNYDKVYIEGEFNDKDPLAAWFIKEGKIQGVFLKDHWNGQNILTEAFRLNLLPTGQEVESGKMKMEDIKKLVLTRSEGKGCCQGKHLWCEKKQGVQL